jgi:hypothetical protein
MAIEAAKFRDITIEGKFVSNGYDHASDINEDGDPDLVAGKRLRGHSGNDAGAADPLCIFWYDINRQDQTFERNVLAYNANIGTGMQMHIVNINNNDRDKDIAVSGKSGLCILENMKY